MLEQLDSELAAALARVHQVIDNRTDWVHAERREMVESARRSLGQRVRWARNALGHLPVNYTPAVFRFHRKE